MNSWALPGGFVRPGESAEQAAARELHEESGLEAVQLRQLALFSAPGRDPRGWIVSCAFLARVDGAEPRFGDDALDARRFTVSAQRTDHRLQLVLAGEALTLNATLSIEDSPQGRQYEIVQSDGIAFDHARILAMALDQISADDRPMPTG